MKKDTEVQNELNSLQNQIVTLQARVRELTEGLRERDPVNPQNIAPSKDELVLGGIYLTESGARVVYIGSMETYSIVEGKRFSFCPTEAIRKTKRKILIDLNHYLVGGPISTALTLPNPRKLHGPKGTVTKAKLRELVRAYRSSNEGGKPLYISCTKSPYPTSDPFNTNHYSIYTSRDYSEIRRIVFINVNGKVHIALRDEANGTYTISEEPILLSPNYVQYPNPTVLCNPYKLNVTDICEPFLIHKGGGRTKLPTAPLRMRLKAQG